MSPAELRAFREIEQIVPSEFCLACDICCRFPESTSPMAPYFAPEERAIAAQSARIPGPEAFRPDGKIKLIPFPANIESPGHQEGSICPAFDPKTHFCGIYPDRPLDCRLYPFLLVRKEGKVILATDSKCPFLSEESRQKDIERYGNRLSFLFSLPQNRKLIEGNPGLVSPFQEDFIPFSILFPDHAR